MPGLVAPETHHYVSAPVTNVKLDYTDLPIMDLAKAGTPEGRLALSQQVVDAMKAHGFFYVVNHGYTTAETERIFDIADSSFSRVSDEEKKVYVSKIKETGVFQGYKPRRYWHIEGGVRDQIETYNAHRDVTKYEHPEVLRPFIPEIEKFARHCHENVLHQVLKLFALGMELPEEAFVNMHGFASSSGTYVRFMKYFPRTDDEENETKNVWLKGHTDMGTITILYSQPVAGLQILAKNGTWKWVKHIENALVINTGDALGFLSGGCYRPTIHRVVQPPEDQRNCARLGVFYFCMADDEVKLEPLVESPVLQREGLVKSMDGGVEPPTMKSWRTARTAAYGQTELKATENGVEEEIIHGMVVKHYN